MSQNGKYFDVSIVLGQTLVIYMSIKGRRRLGEINIERITVSDVKKCGHHK